MTESILDLATWHVAEGEKRVMHQQILMEKLEREGFEARALDAKSLLDTMQETLALMREHLRIERAKGMI